MSYIRDYTKWKSKISESLENRTREKMIGFLENDDLSEALFTKEERKARRKAKRGAKHKDKRAVAKTKTISGNKYKIVRKKDNDPTQDTYIVKTRGKTKIWDEDGNITDEAWDFVKSTIEDSDKDYDNDSIEPILTDKKLRDKIEFTVKVKGTEEEEGEEETVDAKEEEKEEVKTKVKETASIKLSDEDEGSIAKGETSTILPSVRELLQATFSDIEGLAPLFEPYDSKKYIAGQILTDKDVQLINSIRQGFGMKVSGKITDQFLSKVTAENALGTHKESTEEVEGSEAMDRETFDKQKEEEGKAMLSKSESTLYKFNEFLAINEAFDSNAAVAYYKETYSDKEEATGDKAKKSSGSSGGSSSDPTGFTPEQGNLFRAWANRKANISKYGKESKFDLDKEGGHDNKFIRKSWAAAVSSGDHGGIDKILTGDKKAQSVDTVDNTIKSLTNDFNLANEASKKVASFWHGVCDNTGDAPALFKQYKGTFNDDEDAAALAYDRWIKKNITPLTNKIGAKAYKTTLNNVIKATREQMTDSIGNEVNWQIIDASKLDPETSPEEIEGLVDAETFGYWTDVFARTDKGHMIKHSISGKCFDF